MLKVFSDKSYPKVLVEKPSKEIAKLLSHAYASKESELTNIHLYLYQSIILESAYPEISKILNEISKVEMKHLELLGKTIFHLGCDPIYADCNFNLENYWNGFDVYYDTDLKSMLEINIESKKQAIHDYQMLKTVMTDIYINDLIERILLDEQIHLEVFIKLYKQFVEE